MIINYSDQEVIKNKISIFLAGPTPRNNKVDSWRKEACKYLEDKGFNGVVYVPEYSTWKPMDNYLNQVEWEREALSNSSIILFWIPRELKEMPAFTTNVEFGYWLHTGKVIYGRPNNARKVKYLDWLYKKDTNKEPYTDIYELLDNTIEFVNKIGINNKTKILPLEERIIMTNDN
jgi:nucleoside 2-deoxyribosyltransferase